jgi:phospholipid/cholesterol/gamma-HCH transport system substrate-binding protein
MTKAAPSIGKVAAMVLFTLSVFGLLMFLWVSFGGNLPLRPEGYRFKAAFPEAALLVEEADVRMAGVNIGKVKSRELAPGGRRTLAEIEVDERFAPIKANTRAILRQKSLLGETYVELSPGGPGGDDLPDGGTLPDGQIDDTVELDEIFSIFDRRTRRNFEAWLRESGIAFSGDYGRDVNNALGNAAPFFEHGADLLRPLAGQELALRRLVRNTGRVFDAISSENGQLRGLIVNGDRTFGALASRDQARWCATCASPPPTSRLPCATSATSRPISRCSSTTSTRSSTPPRRACRPPSASSVEPSPCSSQRTPSNPS